MRFAGNISAKGGVQSGNGGNAEVSGLTSLGYGGLTDLSATNGLNGTLLLDPRNITIVAGSGAASSVYQEILDPTPGTGEGFGGRQNIELGNGNILISSPLDSTFGTNSGAVYLYTSTGTLISSVVGSAAGDKVGAYTIYDYNGVTVLGNGNVIITSDNWNGGMGAVTWMSSTGLLSTGSAGGAVSNLNSLVGSNVGDKVGSIGNVNGLTQLVNGNVVISSSYWNNGGTSTNALGAVTWMNSSNGKLSNAANGGVVSSTNSLVGSTAGDMVGFGGITQVSGNYVVRSPLWGSGGVAANALGAVTWVNGSNGTLSTGVNGDVLGSTNSLVGSTLGDKVGLMSIKQVNSGSPYTYDQSGISVGSNGNIVITSNNWNNGGTLAGAGAVTWMNGATGALVGGGLGGAISSTNSLVGTTAGDKIGTVDTKPYSWLSSEASGVVWLPNGNYLVRSGQWGSGGVANAGKGAVTWGSGTAGVAGDVSSTNSIVGSTAYDLVGAGWTDSFTADPGLVVLSNSNYVVVSSQWASGTGAVTWGNGATGTSGVVSGIQTAGVAFSLVGSAAGSFVGAQGITAQIGGNNFVVKSPWFDFNTNIDTGALTWMNGATGALSNGSSGGMVDGTNSLIGAYGYDNVGAVVALNNGNFLATTPVWNGGSPSTGLGALTWLNGTTGKLADLSSGGAVSNTNSLVGSTAGDMSGFNIYSSIIQLGNGNLLLKNSNWDNGSNLNVGALTWMNGTTGELSNSTVGTPVYGGVIGTANSLVGAYGGVYTTSIYYPYFYYVGADQVGSAGIDVLASGNVLVRTHNWHNPTGLGADNAGAVTWINGATGKLIDGSSGGLITEFNSLVGDVANSQVGNYNLMQLGNGNVVIRSPQWNGSAGAVTWMNGVTGALSDGTSFGVISAANSLIGSTANDSVGSAGVFELTDYQNNFWNYVVLSSNWSNGAAANAGAITWVNGATGKTANNSGIISTANSLVGSTASDYVGNSSPLVLGNGNVVFSNLYWTDTNVAGATYAGAVTWMNGSTGQLKDASFGGVISNANSLIGSLGWDQVGSGGLTEITDGSTFWNYVVASPYWNGSAGAVTLGNGMNGTVGVVSSSNSLVGGAANDAIGSGGITLVSDGRTFWNYVVKSSSWGVGAGYYLDALGAVTWVNGQTGQLTTGAVGGVVSSSNSLVGSTIGDQVGVAGGFSGGVNIMSNGSLLIRSQYWNGSLSAVTWMNGATGKLVGGANGAVLSASNSLLGSALNDNLGDGGADVLQVNGNWLITSSSWGGNKGAVTWMDSTNGKLADGAFGGVLSGTNSLVGSAVGDSVGGYSMCDCGTPGGILSLSDGNYVVFSPNWSGSGAVTWGNGATGAVGQLSASNSVFGVQLNPYDVNEVLGQSGVVLLGSGGAHGGSGGVYLLGGPLAGASGLLFSDNPDTDTTISAGWIASTLDLGTNVVLQAHNDITQQAGASISATGSGGLTLQAGRSVVLNDTIDILGVLNITANDAGADAGIRQSGAAVIDTTMATIAASQINLTNTGGNIQVDALNATSGAIMIAAFGDVLIPSSTPVISSSTDIIVVANNFTNLGGNPFSATGRWLVYSNGPLTDAKGGLSYNFKQYNTAFGGTILGTGSGFIYTVAPTVSVGLTGSVSKVYDGTTLAALTVDNFAISGTLDGDSLVTPTSGTYDNKNAGTGKVVTVANNLYATNGGVNVYGYQYLFTPNAAIGDISQLALTGTQISSINTTYGTPAAAGAVSFGNIIAGDVVSSIATVNSVASDLSSSGNLNAGSYTQIATSLSGADAANYIFTGFTSAANYNVNKLALNGTQIAGINTTYGTPATAGAVSFGNIIAGDVVSSIATVNSVASDLSSSGNLNAGSYTQIATSLSGADAANYSFTGFTSAANYNVNKLALNGTQITGINTTYGTPAAAGAVSFGNIIAGDVVSSIATVNSVASDLSSSGNLNAGSYTQIATSLSGADAANYSFTGFTSAANYNVGKASIVEVIGMRANNKVYDGNLSSILDSGVAQFSGMVAGDRLTVANATGSFSDRNVGTGKVVTIGGISLGGIDAGNYVLQRATASAAADISQLQSVTWTGLGLSSLWSDAANWSGGALPDGMNVAAVVIPVSSSVMFDSSVGTTTLDSLTNNGSLTVANGSILTVVSSLINTSNFTLNVQGVLNAGATLNTGTINIAGGAAPTFNATAGLNNLGVINVGDPALTSGASSLSVAGVLSNANTINSVGTLGTRSLTAGTLFNTGTIEMSYPMTIGGTLYAAGSVLKPINQYGEAEKITNIVISMAPSDNQYFSTPDETEEESRDVSSLLEEGLSEGSGIPLVSQLPICQ
ncbi:MAG: YDG domain-containing protein [Sideroxydans sp.]|nr:YDG domain-containing protein [Sideroxydans sp.]